MLGTYSKAQNIGNLDGIYYQAVALDDNTQQIVGLDIAAKPLYNREIGVRFTITKGLNGDVEWEETHTTTTDKYGLFSLTIGKGNVTSTAYASLLDIPWIDADQFLKVEISTKNDGNYKEVNNQKFMTVPYAFYTDDIADDAITTQKIKNEEILAEDIATGAVTTDEILDETIQANDIATGAVTSDEILDETIQANDIDTNAVTSDEILDETIQANDIDTAAVETSEIKNGTILNEDIADSTINLRYKVMDTLSVANGGTGNGFLPANSILIGNDSSAISNLGVASNGQIPIGVTGGKPVLANISAGTGIKVTNSAGGITIESTISGGVNSNANTSVNPGVIVAGKRWLSPAFVLQQPTDLSSPIAMGDILIASADVDLQGCLISVYLTDANNSVAHARVAIYNPDTSNVNLGNGVAIKILVVK